MKSSSLMEEVVKKLDLYNSIFNEGKVRTEELFGNNSPLKFVAENKDSIDGVGKYYFEIDWKKELVKIAGQNIPFDSSFILGSTTYKIEINETYNRNVIGKNYYVNFTTVAAAATRITSTLKAAPLSYASTVIDLKMETPLPEKGVAILNELFNVYSKAGIVDKKAFKDE